MHPSIVEERHPGGYRARGFREDLRLEEFSASLVLWKEHRNLSPCWAPFSFFLSKLFNFICMSQHKEFKVNCCRNQPTSTSDFRVCALGWGCHPWRTGVLNICIYVCIYIQIGVDILLSEFAMYHCILITRENKYMECILPLICHHSLSVDISVWSLLSFLLSSNVSSEPFSIRGFRRSLSIDLKFVPHC